jgi:hypothetical protein
MAKPKKLHFGVFDVPYPEGHSTRTTHEVATFLEEKYGVIEMFVTDKEKDIRELVKRQSERHARQVVAGVEPSLNPMLAEIKAMFVPYIRARKLDWRVKGVPTKAARLGINHSLKYPYGVPTAASKKAGGRLKYIRRNPERPSFYDTGLYANSFRAWVE